MKDLQKCNEIASILRQKLSGQKSKTYEGIIVDVFTVPNMLILAKAVYRERLNNAWFPFLPSDDLTIVAAFNDHRLEDVKDVIRQDDLKDFEELISPLAEMLDPTQEREREQQKTS